ncbi:MAG: tRNA (adenosine(37)-N6)-threonylcarbamoyltransferase complex ATPase subunit type 1 TsaE [Rikenellaceae bacterium]|nr:tRNA (adenosine(37)-N6)-threonylcarbamoyltransferase complex ATPase subunit type 1 TsaE [Rikenellaceae bacterium]
METFEYRLSGLAEAADRLIPLFRQHRTVALYGAMGAGKTTLISAIAARMGSDDTVTSPTFALVNQYRTADRQTIYHFDFYRIDRLEEAYDLGYEEYFFSGDLCLIEWPEKIEPLLPEDTLRLRIEILDEQTRRIGIER